MDKIHQVTITCPITLGPIDSVTGEPQRPDVFKYRADVLRDELQPYDISSLAYTGNFRYRAQALDDGDELTNPPNIRVNICGSWTGFKKYEEMEVQDDGTYMTTMILGDTRMESFFLVLNGLNDFRAYPMTNKGTMRHWVYGFDHKGEGKRWVIDGRDDVPAGTVYQVRFHWGERRKRVSWEEVDPSHVSEATRYTHRYQIQGSWTSKSMEDMRPAEDGIWEWRGKIGVSGQEIFQIVRDNDKQQIIYPAENNCLNTTVPVRGPDDLSEGKYWLVNGPVGEIVKIRLEIDEGKIIVALKSKTQGEKVWESVEGWERHDYWLVFKNGPCTKMTKDPEAPGVFRGHGKVGQTYSEQYRGLCEFFSIIVDNDPKFAFYPEVACAGSGETIVWGPDKDSSGRPFMVKSWQEGADFEVVLDLTAEDKRKTVTWTWGTPQQFNFATAAIVDA